MTILLVLLFSALILAFARQAWNDGVLVQYWGMIGLAGGISAGYFSFQSLLVLADKLEGDNPLSAGVLAIVSIVFGFVVYFIVRGISKALLVRCFGEDSSLEEWTMGIPGALLSLGPSILAILVLASGMRLVGTLMEWRHLETVSRAGTGFSEGKYPDWPTSTRWRNAVEDIPVLYDFLNSLDPISRHAERHIVCLLVASKHPDLLDYLRSEPETSPAFEAAAMQKLIDSEDITSLLQEPRHVSLVTHALVRQAARDPGVSKALEDLELQPLIDAFMISGE